MLTKKSRANGGWVILSLATILVFGAGAFGQTNDDLTLRAEYLFNAEAPFSDSSGNELPNVVLDAGGSAGITPGPDGEVYDTLGNRGGVTIPAGAWPPDGGSATISMDINLNNPKVTDDFYFATGCGDNWMQFEWGETINPGGTAVLNINNWSLDAVNYIWWGTTAGPINWGDQWHHFVFSQSDEMDMRMIWVDNVLYCLGGAPLDSDNPEECEQPGVDMSGSFGICEVADIIGLADNVRVYEGWTLEGDTLDIYDPKVLTNPSTAEVIEGVTSDTFTAVLAEAPTADVDILFHPVLGGEINLSGMEDPNLELTFTSADWDTPQTVTVVADDDAEKEGTEVGKIELIVTSGDAEYDGEHVRPLQVTVIDDDSAFVLLETGDGIEVAEGGNDDTYSIRLLTAPSSDVHVNLDDLADPNDLEMTPNSLTFTISDWSTPQTVTVAAVNDDIPETSPDTTTINHAISSDDPEYAALADASVEATIREKTCGAGPFNVSDLDDNCITNLLDWAALASQYLDCSIGIGSCI